MRNRKGLRPAAGRRCCSLHENKHTIPSMCDTRFDAGAMRLTNEIAGVESCEIRPVGVGGGGGGLDD